MQVGAATEAELEDRKLRVEDAKNATFAAVSAVLDAACCDAPSFSTELASNSCSISIANAKCAAPSTL